MFLLCEFELTVNQFYPIKKCVFILEYGGRGTGRATIVYEQNDVENTENTQFAQVIG